MNVVESWDKKKVNGRDEVLRDIEKRAGIYKEQVVEDVLNVMRNYEVDLYRYIMAVGERYGNDIAYEIQSDTVTKMRLKWYEQNKDFLSNNGSDLDRGLDLYLKYLKLQQEDYVIIEKSDHHAVFRRKEYVDMITYTCRVLGLDIIEISNTIYARATNFMLARINPNLKYVVLDYHDGWFEERIELGS